jgi:hypothetical protein
MLLRIANALIFVVIVLACAPATGMPASQSIRTPSDLVKELTIAAASEVNLGDTPEQVTSFLKKHQFRHSRYDQGEHSLVGLALFDIAGQKTDPDHYSFHVSIRFAFDEQDRLKDYDITQESLKTTIPMLSDEAEDQDSADDEEPPEAITLQFASPDKKCQLAYEGLPDHGDGILYDVTNGKKVEVLKEYFRLGPDVRWISNSIAEIFFSEGSPAYHSYYYDCAALRISRSYFQSIAFNPQERLVATLENKAIVFYRLFGDKEIYRAKLPSLDMMEYFDCDSSAVFDSATVLHLQILRRRCGKGADIDVKISVPPR